MIPRVLCEIICEILDMANIEPVENVAIVNKIIIFIKMATFEGMSMYKLI